MSAVESPVAGLTTRPAAGTTWRERALCAETDPEIFFPERGYSQKDALAVCGRCPVRAECLQWALAHGERGIWGGTTERARRRMGGASPHDPVEQERTREILALTRQGLSAAEIAVRLGYDRRTVIRVRVAAQSQAARTTTGA